MWGFIPVKVDHLTIFNLVIGPLIPNTRPVWIKAHDTQFGIIVLEVIQVKLEYYSLSQEQDDL